MKNELGLQFSWVLPTSVALPFSTLHWFGTEETKWPDKGDNSYYSPQVQIIYKLGHGRPMREAEALDSNWPGVYYSAAELNSDHTAISLLREFISQYELFHFPGIIQCLLTVYVNLQRSLFSLINGLEINEIFSGFIQCLWFCYFTCMLRNMLWWNVRQPILSKSYFQSQFYFV